MIVLLGPSPLSGIGQVMLKYCRLFRTKKYVQYGQQIHPSLRGDLLFAFVLPIPSHVNTVKALQGRFRRVCAMTVCETDRVHQSYGTLAQETNWRWFTPSEFCRTTLTDQFPKWDIQVLHHWAPTPRLVPLPDGDPLPYVFYTICNAHDPRKQVRKIIEAFIRCNLPTTKLLIKSTSAKPYTAPLPNVEVINGLLSDEEMEESVHQKGHCYVSFSNSEGVGMGPVEAALREKPVIIPEWGGCKEYVHTPYLIPCQEKEIGYDDFLFESTMKWGNPNFESLCAFMTEVHKERITICEHAHTHSLMDNPSILFNKLGLRVPTK